MRRIHPVLSVVLVVLLGGAAWWWMAARNEANVATVSAPTPSGAAATRAGNAPGPATIPPAVAATDARAGLASVSSALARLTYARGWGAELPPAFAAFRVWTERFLNAANSASAAQRTALEVEGLALAQSRRAAMKSLIERDPRAALEVTVPAAIRAQLPAAVVAELETRFSALGDFTVLAIDYGPKELIRRQQMGLSTDPFQQTVQWAGATEYRAFVYGRRDGQTTKVGIPLHGVLLDEIVALHESAVRALEPGESAPAGQLPVEVARASLPSISAAAIVVEIGGKVYRFATTEDVVRAEGKLAAAEAGIGPQRIPSINSVLLGVEPTVKSAGTISPANEALPATPWTVGNKKVLIIRVDFSDLTGDPKSGGTTYTSGYVQDLSDAQLNPYFARSSFGAATLTNTVTTQVYRLPKTATYYATTGTGGAHTELHTAARTAAAAHYTIASYDRLVVLFSSLAGLAGSKITYAGLANVGGPNAWINGEFAFRVVAHELGHTFGLRHANLWKVTDGNPVSTATTATTAEYGDDFDTMGANFANDPRTDFNPWFKNLLGWIADSQVLTVTSTGTYRINRFDHVTGTGTLALSVTRDSTRNYWIGARRTFTTHATMQHGAYVIWGYNTNQASNLLDLGTPGTDVSDAALALGATLLDPVGNVSIKTLAEGGTAPNEYLDVLVTVGLNGLPVISAHPASQGFAVGATVTLSVTATGTAPLAYQWRKYGVNLPGATAATYLIADAQAHHAGTYAVQISNAVATIVSNSAALSVNALPFLAVPPRHVTAAAGLTATFSVGVTGFPLPTSYQWRQAGTLLAGATAATFVIPHAQATHAGNYDVVVTNVLGTTTSATVSLTVHPASTPPANDNFATAWTLAGNVGVALGTVIGATGETGEPTHVSTDGTASSVWYRWTPTASGIARVDTIGSPFDSVLAVYSGSALSALTKLGEDDDGGDPAGGGPSLVTFPVTAGTTYAIAVGSFDTGFRGSVTLNYEAVALALITHSGDTDRDFSFSLGELTRVIELYNTRKGTLRTGCYALATTTTDDGFAADANRLFGEPVSLARYHSADSNLDGRFSLIELTRVIELFNVRSGTTRTGAYRVQAGSEDGFAPGP